MNSFKPKGVLPISSGPYTSIAVRALAGDLVFENLQMFHFTPLYPGQKVQGLVRA